MKKKKVLLKVAIFIHFNIVLLLVFHIGMFMGAITPKPYISLIGDNYYKKEGHYSIDTYNDLLKFYYNEEPNYLENKEYILVGNKTEKIKVIIKDSLAELRETNNVNIDFDYDSVTSNDRFYLIKKSFFESMLLHYYDVDENILYVIGT